MNDGQKVLGLVVIVIGAALILRWLCKQSPASSPTCTDVGTVAGPAYLETAATSDVSVPGVPEEQSCPGKKPAPGDGAKTEGGYGCK